MTDYTETENYTLKLPLGEAKMNNNAPSPNVLDYLDGNFTAIEGIPAAPSVTGPLPQESGGVDYNLGDRVYRTDDQSIYVLICKDPWWGWYWKPIQAAISPWTPVPDSAINSASFWETHSAKPMEIAHDNRGRCHWRGGIVFTTGPIPSNTSQAPFAFLPKGLRPRNIYSARIGADTLTGGAVLTKAACQGASIVISNDSDEIPIVRVHQNGSNSIDELFFDGCVEYSVGESIFTTP